MSWNSLVPEGRRFKSPQKTNGRTVEKPTHVVCHITGTDSFSSVKNEFMTDASIHYLIDKQGAIYQFVEEESTAWHAGIKASVQALYNNGNGDWKKYLYYFPWYKYPAGSTYLDGQFNKVEGGREATFVAQASGAPWQLYQYFEDRWGSAAGPLNYATSKRPNDYSIGIEILSVGAKTPSPTAYTEAMYRSLSVLVNDICERNAIPKQKGRVVGHEDVNPVQRYGWDPNKGFDWARLWQTG